MLLSLGRRRKNRRRRWNWRKRRRRKGESRRNRKKRVSDRICENLGGGEEWKEERDLAFHFHSFGVDNSIKAE